MRMSGQSGNKKSRENRKGIENVLREGRAEAGEERGGGGGGGAEESKARGESSNGTSL